MSVYAKGRKSVAISDRSGFRVPYKNLRTEWNGSRVAPDEYEPKNPQLTPPKNIIDATALFKPRPDNDPDNIIINLAFNWFNTNTTSLDSTQYDQPNVGASCLGEIGVFSYSTEADVTGVAGTGAIGTSTIVGAAVVTGVAGTGEIGTETPTASAVETSVTGTGQIGIFGETDGANVQLSLTETSVTGTGQIGTVSINLAGWGNSTWGQGTWGD
jgi:hypothetical protein